MGIDGRYKPGDRAMNTMKMVHSRSILKVCCFLLALELAYLPAIASTPASAPAAHDPQHDFDFEIGNWNTHVKRLLHPLTGSDAWAEYDGTTLVQPVWGGKANL